MRMTKTYMGVMKRAVRTKIMKIIMKTIMKMRDIEKVGRRMWAKMAKKRRILARHWRMKMKKWWMYDLL